MNIKIIVAAHKPYRMPEDPMYLPLQVGAEIAEKDLGFEKDDRGDNISGKNPFYCELTGLYWAWKNLSCDALGLAHYRRHFSVKRSGDKWERILSTGEAEALLQEADVLLPKRRNYYIETNYSQYAHAHRAEDLEMVREILQQTCPEYLPAYDAGMQRTWGHRFNMFLMKKPQADAYCSWMFAVLFELERRMKETGDGTIAPRVFGFVSERLLDVWLETNDIRYREIPYVFLEKQNWLKKGSSFLLRKIRGSKRA